MTQISSATSQERIEQAEKWGAHNYHPLPVVVAKAEGPWIYDVEGKKYLDMLSAYSSLNFGHRNERLLDAARVQLDRVTLTSRAFYNDQQGDFCEALARLCGLEAVLMMNTGSEAVESAIKVARKWAYDIKGVAPDTAKIIVCTNNFHGRTTTIISFSGDPDARDGFGPYTPGFVTVPYGDIDALRDAIDDDTAAFLVEPIQGEAGVIIPPSGFLRAARDLCAERDVLFIADEIQSAFGRTGRTFACEHEDVVPDIFILGKALGGGIYPLSAIVTRSEIMNVIGPGQHGSTFGGNPLACTIGREVIAIMNEGQVQTRAAELGQRLTNALRAADLAKVKDIRAIGLWLGIDMDPELLTGRRTAELLLKEGVLSKETHGSTIRLSPPLVMTNEDVDWAVERLSRVLS